MSSETWGYGAISVAVTTVNPGTRSKCRLDRRGARIAAFQKGDQGPGIYADAGKVHAFHP